MLYTRVSYKTRSLLLVKKKNKKKMREYEPKHASIEPATFIENVEEYLKDKDSVEEELRKIQNQFERYKMLELHLARRKANIGTKLPNIRKTLAAVDLLYSKQEEDEPIRTQFDIAAGVYATAKLKHPPKHVCMWLGANVMVEYPIEEARELLQNNLKGASKLLEELSSDLGYLKEQIIITQVNTARVYNFDVKRRRKTEAAGSEDSEKQA